MVVWEADRHLLPGTEIMFTGQVILTNDGELVASGEYHVMDERGREVQVSERGRVFLWWDIIDRVGVDIHEVIADNNEYMVFNHFENY